MQAQSSDEVPSISPRNESRAYQPYQKTDTIINYTQIIKAALKGYEDVNDADFQMIDEGNQNPFQHNSSNYMNNYHRTLVPIGANFQVFIPPIMTESAYKIKSKAQMKTLKTLKLNDPEEGEEFYNQYFQIIENRFGPGRTYQDVNTLRNALRRMNSQVTFEEYLSKYHKYWQNHFKIKDRATAPKVERKKKKKKGTIPV